MNYSALKRQARKRWDRLARSEQIRLTEELKGKGNQYAVELTKRWHDNGYQSTGCVINIFFGMDFSANSEYRYLMLSDILELEQAQEKLLQEDEAKGRNSIQPRRKGKTIQ